MFNPKRGSAVTQYLLLSGLLLGSLCWRADTSAFSWMRQKVQRQSLPRELPHSFTSHTHPENTDSFTLPNPTRAVVIDPTTQAVTLKAINSHQ
jgi:hypothetical protein